MPKELPLPEEMYAVTDMMGRIVQVPVSPKRIISLVPSQTELLFDLGLEKQIVGITKFCIYPAEKVKSVTKIGGTKNFHFDVIDQLQPDLIIGNKEENYFDGINQLAEKYPVWMSDILDLPDALRMIAEVSNLVQKPLTGNELVKQAEQAFANLGGFADLSVAYFIWQKPYMVAGKNTFIQDMLSRMGLRNVFVDRESRYPEISAEALQQAQPDVILLSSEPYPFNEKHIAEMQELLPHSKVVLVDGEMFSWYGSRLLKTPAYLQKLQAQLI